MLKAEYSILNRKQEQLPDEKTETSVPIKRVNIYETG